MTNYFHPDGCVCSECAKPEPSPCECLTCVENRRQGRPTIAWADANHRNCKCAACQAPEVSAALVALAKPKPIASKHPEWLYFVGCPCAPCATFRRAYRDKHDGASPPAKVPAEPELQTIEQIVERVILEPGSDFEYEAGCECYDCKRVRNDPMFPGEPHGTFAPVTSVDVLGTVKEDGLKHLAAVSDRIIEASQRKQTNRNLRGVFG